MDFQHCCKLGRTTRFLQLLGTCASSLPGPIGICCYSPCVFSAHLSSLGWMDFVYQSKFVDLLFLLYVWDVNGYVWGEDSVSPGRSQCLCLVTQSSFGSLALLQKLNLSIGGAVESPHSQSCGLLRNDLCLPLTGEKLFSLVHFKFPNRREVPVWDKCRWLHRLPGN